jgi:anaphase-promoting complex subunit 10
MDIQDEDIIMLQGTVQVPDNGVAHGVNPYMMTNNDPQDNQDPIVDDIGGGDADEEGEEEGEEEEDESTTVAQEHNTTNAESITVKATPELLSLTNPNLREISHEAVWSLSSCKPGNGVTQLMDCSTDTYWQSDGTQPHLINIHFSKRKAVCEVAFYLDYTLDESYTPKRIGIKSGTTFHDLEEIKVVEMKEPTGWVSVPLHAKADPLDDDLNDCEDDFISNSKRMEERERKLKSRPLRTHLIQICILSMAQNGRDTHVRQVKLFGPRAGSDAESINAPLTGFALGLPRFQTVELSQFSTIR